MSAAEDFKALIVYDGKQGPTATQVISFGRPFEHVGGSPEVTIQFQSHCADLEGIQKIFASRRPDLLVLSRYTSALGRNWIRLARQTGVPVIFHIDDDLLAVPPSLGEAKYKAYNDPQRLAALRANIEATDLLYVSTAELARRCTGHGLRTPISAGEIYCSVDPDEVGALLPSASGPVIGYMGTGGHAADLEMILPAICRAMDSIPELQFETFGTIAMPTALAKYGERVRSLPATADYQDFISQLRSLGWWIGLAPLGDNPFNRCKADTKWVEYSLAGIAVIASDLAVYHRACADGAGILATSDDDWAAAIHELIYRPESRVRMIGLAQAKLRNMYSHDRLRSQVTAVFDRARDVSGVQVRV